MIISKVFHLLKKKVIRCVPRDSRHDSITKVIHIRQRRPVKYGAEKRTGLMNPDMPAYHRQEEKMKGIPMVTFK
jgi:hypothetical protein